MVWDLVGRDARHADGDPGSEGGAKGVAGISGLVDKANPGAADEKTMASRVSDASGAVADVAGGLQSTLKWAEARRRAPQAAHGDVHAEQLSQELRVGRQLPWATT